MFKADAKGESQCYDAGAEAWPPYLTADQPKAATDPVQCRLIDTIERRDGSQQVTYNRWALYCYCQDARIGDSNGQDVGGFGAEWYLVAPDGDVIEETADAS